MKVSEAWLREWVNPAVDTETLCDQLTNLGLEVDGIEPTFEHLRGVVVGQIREVESISNSSEKSISRCLVDDGSGLHTVVCGAPNVQAELKTAFARPGISLTDNKTVEATTLYGVSSQGMLCSEADLGLSTDHSGILEFDNRAQVGEEIVDVLGLTDITIDIDLTPNRGDCLSVRGIAREVGVINHLSSTEPANVTIPPQTTREIPIQLAEREACPRYLGRVISNVRTDAETPRWMVQRLVGCGLRAIEPVVDVTNYVMLELGQPLHAFDLRNVTDGIVVRKSHKGEQLKMLDGSELKLDEDTLLITDGPTPLAVAGVMGGELSGIRTDTTDVFLECAYFSPDYIIGTARKYAMQTDASMRYERGVDPELQLRAIERTTELLSEVVGGEPGPITVAEADEFLPERKSTSLTRSSLDRLVGEAINDGEVEEILTLLDLSPTRCDDGWDVVVPSHRFDISIEEDLVEEICRVHGYNSIGATYPFAELRFDALGSRISQSQAVRDCIAERGYYEVVNYSFIDSAINNRFVPILDAPVLENPLATQYASMRKSLLPGLIESAKYNLSRQQENIRLYEFGKCFTRDQGRTTQIDHLGGIAIGNQSPESWSHSKTTLDFFDIKGDLEHLFEHSVKNVQYQRVDCVYLHPGHAAAILVDDEPIGKFGKLHPEFSMEFELPVDTFVFEIEVELLNGQTTPIISHVAPFPYVRRDLALLVDKETPVQSLIETIQREVGDLLKDLHVFDLYEGNNIEMGKKSLAIGLTLQDEQRTLTDQIVNEVVLKIVERLKSEFDALQR